MTKVLLMVGSSMGDSPDYFIIESALAEKIIGPEDSANWSDPWEHLSESLDEDGEYPKGVIQFESVREAMDYVQKNNLEVEEEVDFVIY